MTDGGITWLLLLAEFGVVLGGSRVESFGQATPLPPGHPPTGGSGSLPAPPPPAPDAGKPGLIWTAPEHPDGQLRLLLVAWTDLVPRPAPQTKGRPMPLAPDAMRGLGAWVAARMS